jgi:hypothetical protein
MQAHVREFTADDRCGPESGIFRDKDKDRVVLIGSELASSNICNRTWDELLSLRLGAEFAIGALNTNRAKSSSHLYDGSYWYLRATRREHELDQFLGRTKPAARRGHWDIELKDIQFDVPTPLVTMESSSPRTVGTSYP